MRGVTPAMRRKVRAGMTAKEMTAVVSRMKRAVVVRDKTIMRTIMRMETIVGMTIMKNTVMMIENDERRAREERASSKASDRPPPPC
jgi:hypothetical protein